MYLSFDIWILSDMTIMTKWIKKKTSSCGNPVLFRTVEKLVEKQLKTQDVIHQPILAFHG